MPRQVAWCLRSGRKQTIDEDCDGRPEQDRYHDGEVDAKPTYAGGRQRLDMDKDRDGHFETRTAFDTAEWTKVTELVDKTDHLWQPVDKVGIAETASVGYSSAYGSSADYLGMVRGQ